MAHECNSYGKLSNERRAQLQQCVREEQFTAILRLIDRRALSKIHFTENPFHILLQGLYHTSWCKHHFLFCSFPQWFTQRPSLHPL